MRWQRSPRTSACRPKASRSTTRCASVLTEVVRELFGDDVAIDPAVAGQVLGLARTFTRQAVDLIEAPGRRGDWAVIDPMLLQGIGRMSGAIAGAFRAAEGDLPGLGEALGRAGARFLDIGTGTAWLAIATAHAYPHAHVVGIDVFDTALDAGPSERRGIGSDRPGRGAHAGRIDARRARHLRRHLAAAAVPARGDRPGGGRSGGGCAAPQADGCWRARSPAPAIGWRRCSPTCGRCARAGTRGRRTRSSPIWVPPGWSMPTRCRAPGPHPFGCGRPVAPELDLGDGQQGSASWSGTSS